jgi:hypothetical protein
VKRSKVTIVVAMIVLVVTKASDTHIPYPFYNYALVVFIVVCMIGWFQIESEKCLDPSSV